MEVREERDHIPTVYCHHQNDSCIKMGSDENNFNVSLILRDKVTRRQCPQTTTFLKRRRAEEESKRGPSAYRLTSRPTEGELFISAQLSIVAVSALRKVWVVLYNKTVEAT